MELLEPHRYAGKVQLIYENMVIPGFQGFEEGSRFGDAICLLCPRLWFCDSEGGPASVPSLQPLQMRY